MGFISDSMAEQLGQIGKPKVTTSKETVTQDEPLNIGTMALMALMLMESYMNKAPTTPIMGPGGGPFGADKFGVQNLPKLGVTPVQPPVFQPSVAGVPSSFTNLDPMALKDFLARWGK